MIHLPAYLTGFSSKSDGSASIRFATQELTSEDFGNLKQALNNYGHLLFKENEFKVEDIPKEDVEDKNKTPSKRLRATLFCLWNQRGSPDTFDSFYQMQMEKIISHIKSKLD